MSRKTDEKILRGVSGGTRGFPLDPSLAYLDPEDYAADMRAQNRRAWSVTRDLNAVLDLNPHYTDRRHTESPTHEAWTVFGAEEKGLFYNYSDRIWQADARKADAAVKAANDSGAKPNTARWLTEYLSAFHGQRIELRHVMAGVNASNGYAYNVFGYLFLEEKETSP